MALPPGLEMREELAESEEGDYANGVEEDEDERDDSAMAVDLISENGSRSQGDAGDLHLSNGFA